MMDNILINGDAAKALSTLKEAEVAFDMIFAEPPYNISKIAAMHNVDRPEGGKYNGMKEDWDIFSDKSYVRFTDEWIRNLLWVTHAKSNILIANSLHSLPYVLPIVNSIDEFKIMNILVWHRTNPMPNLSRRLFTHSLEYVIWVTRGKGYTFNYDRIKEINPVKAKDGGNKQMHDFLQGLIECPSPSGKKRYKDENGKALHPNQKPVYFCDTIIEALSNAGDTILDLFSGSGVMAERSSALGRNFVSVDITAKYILDLADRLGMNKDEIIKL